MLADPVPGEAKTKPKAERPAAEPRLQPGQLRLRDPQASRTSSCRRNRARHAQGLVPYTRDAARLQGAAIPGTGGEQVVPPQQLSRSDSMAESSGRRVFSQKLLFCERDAVLITHAFPLGKSLHDTRRTVSLLRFPKKNGNVIKMPLEIFKFLLLRIRK